MSLLIDRLVLFQLVNQVLNEHETILAQFVWQSQYIFEFFYKHSIILVLCEYLFDSIKLNHYLFSSIPYHQLLVSETRFNNVSEIVSAQHSQPFDTLISDDIIAITIQPCL